MDNDQIFFKQNIEYYCGELFINTWEEHTNLKTL